jgi:S-adenosylmethionine synthetase
VYGQSKRDGEVAVLKETEARHNSGRTLGLVLRVPLLYGNVTEENDPSIDGLHMLVKQIWEAQKIKAGDPKIKTDNYAVRFPTSTQDVGRVVVDLSELYLRTTDKALPKILHFSSKTPYTRYQIAEILAEILGLPTDGLEEWDPSKEVQEGSTHRPYNTQLDTSKLEELGIDAGTMDFQGWWRWDLNAVRR